MIRIVVFSRSDEFDRSVRRSIQQWGIAQLALAARSLREITTFNGYDVMVVHNAQDDEIDAIAEADRPLVVVGESPGRLFGHDDIHVVMGLGAEHDPNRVIAAAVAAAHGLAVQDSIDPGAYLRSGISDPLAQRSQEPTPREIEVLQLISAGHPNREIARALGISENTVKYHLSGLFAKLGVANRTEATFEGIRRGIVTL